MTNDRIGQEDLARIPPIPAGDEWAGHYYWDDIQAALTPAQWARFREWMWGQTTGLASDGRGVVYAWDLDRWMRGMPIVD